jgi:hypothetical protein
MLCPLLLYWCQTGENWAALALLVDLAHESLIAATAGLMTLKILHYQTLLILCCASCARVLPRTRLLRKSVAAHSPQHPLRCSHHTS